MRDASKRTGGPDWDPIDQALDAYEDLPPESWKPKPGDRIKGELVRYVKASNHYGTFLVAHLRVPAGEDHGEYVGAVWLSHRVLLEAFKEKQPRPGERVGIRRLEDRKTADGKTTYAMYAVAVDRGGETEQAPDWDQVDVESDAAPI